MPAPNGKPLSPQLRLVGLQFGRGAFYAYGDGMLSPLDVRAVDIPGIVAAVSSSHPYALVAKSLEMMAPEGANAFALSLPGFRYASKDLYDIAVQFYAMPHESWLKALAHRHEQDMLRGYFSDQLRNHDQ